MLEILNIVKGSVSSKDLVPVLTHFALHDGRICGYDGRVYISAPYAYADRHAFTVPAIEFIAAMEVCEGASSVFSVGDGFLNITSGHFKARLPTGPLENFPLVAPEGKHVANKKGGFIDVLRKLRPFIGEDASRPWSSGILLLGIKAVATNNITIAEASLPFLIASSCILPVFAIDELLRLDLEPVSYSVTPEAMVFYLPGKIWLRTKLIAGQWPEGALTIIREFHGKAKWKKIPGELSEAVNRIRPFCASQANPVIRFSDGQVSTECETMAAEVKGFTGLGACEFRVEPLLEVLAKATHYDLSLFPRIPWKGHDLGGVMVGVVT